jgi:hypothetical protein
LIFLEEYPRKSKYLNNHLYKKKEQIMKGRKYLNKNDKEDIGLSNSY